MTAEHPKLELLIKLLSKSTTDCDPEALMAIRAANRALSAEGWTWEQLLHRRIIVVADPFVAMARPQAEATRGFSPPKAPQRPTPPPRPAPPPPPPKPCVQPNKYQDSCYCCGKLTPSMKGFIFQSAGGKWAVACVSCSQFLNSGGQPPPRKVRPQKMSVDDVFSSI